MLILECLLQGSCHTICVLVFVVYQVNYSNAATGDIGWPRTKAKPKTLRQPSKALALCTTAAAVLMQHTCTDQSDLVPATPAQHD